MRVVNLIQHTTCGTEFELVTVPTGESSGRMYWDGDEDEGFDYWRKVIAKKGWTIKEEIWS